MAATGAYRANISVVLAVLGWRRHSLHPPSQNGVEMRLAKCLLIAVVSLGITSCATIFGGGSSQTVSFASDPAAANFTVKSSSGLMMSQGKTPATIRLPRKNEYQIEFNAPGFQQQSMVLTKGINGWIWPNLLLGGIVGLAIDFATGSAWKLEPALVNVTLQKGSGDDNENWYSHIQVYDSNGRLIKDLLTRLDPLKR
jgi:hypothetical protein